MQCFCYVQWLVEDERNLVCSAFGTFLVDLADGVSPIFSERNSDNKAVATSFPSVLSKEFTSMVPSSFVQVVIGFRFRLKKIFIERYIKALKEEHRFLLDRYL